MKAAVKPVLIVLVVIAIATRIPALCSLIFGGGSTDSTVDPSQI